MPFTDPEGESSGANPIGGMDEGAAGRIARTGGGGLRVGAPNLAGRAAQRVINHVSVGRNNPVIVKVQKTPKIGKQFTGRGISQHIPLYHGSPSKMDVGDVITAQTPVINNNNKNGSSRGNRANASIYRGNASQYGDHVYRVTPVNPFEATMTNITDRWVGRRTEGPNAGMRGLPFKGQIVSKKGFKVVEEVPKAPPPSKDLNRRPRAEQKRMKARAKYLDSLPNVEGPL